MIVSTWTKAEVRALRQAALRMTQEEFAEFVGFKVETVQKWEQKATTDRPVRGRSAEALDTVYQRLSYAQEQRFWIHLHGARPATNWHPVLSGAAPVLASSNTPGSTESGAVEREVDEEVRRRDFGKLAATGAVAFLSGDHARIGMSDAHRLLAAVDTLEQQDQHTGGAELVDFALGQLERAKHTLHISTYDSKTGVAFTSATGELAVLTGWLAYDADRHRLAQRCFADAMALGTEADNDDLIADTCLCAANQSIALARAGKGSPHKALQLVGRARDLMRGRPPGRIHALIAVREAQAEAALGDRIAFGRAIATAWREMDHAAQFEAIEDCPQWLRFVNHAEIGGHEARGYGDVGDLPRSLELYTIAADQQAGTRNAINLRAWIATTRAQMGDVAGALETGTPVITDLSTVASTRTLRVLEPVRRAADDMAAGDTFRHQFDALTQKAITG
ncbi:hypothetical protein C5E45_29620 [Nocardia nova]|uniref:HTH cro/C1-type domain-containing protein n=2 Tax=Nocardia nova TaxID=37330 RepID=A0A2S6AHG4_9NOCA|nr:hypothetical protein C5E41_27860 [Nocardia nova]PPJ34654.1 hypothetical protein C5E45_29620 [Nocardia nova]